MKAYIEIRFVVDHIYVAGTHNKPIKIKIPKDLIQALKEGKDNNETQPKNT